MHDVLKALQTITANGSHDRKQAVHTSECVLIVLTALEAASAELTTDQASTAWCKTTGIATKIASSGPTSVSTVRALNQVASKVFKHRALLANPKKAGA